MARNLKDYLLISLKGIAMGAADTVPGVSGGTIAFISGIYEELINSISQIDFSLLKTWKNQGFTEVWKKINGNFLIALILGILFSVFTIMRLTKYLLEHHPIAIWAFFFGLVLASIWFVAKQIRQWQVGTILALILSAAAAFWITTFSASNGTPTSEWFLFVGGAIAICAMILPGISGAFIFVLMGIYGEITTAVADFDIKKILVTGLGMITGLLVFSKVLKWLFAKHEQITLAALTGFIAGSLNKIWPWKEVLQSKVINDETVILAEKSIWPNDFNGDPLLIQALLFFIFGFLLIFALEVLSNKISGKNVKNTNA